MPTAPKGTLLTAAQSWMINSTDQLFQAKDYQPLIISYRQGAAVRLADVATVTGRGRRRAQ